MILPASRAAGDLRSGPRQETSMFGRVKPLDAILATAEKKSLHRSLGAFQLTMLGVGAVIGTGIFVLTAEAAQKAGPGMMISFMIAGFVCVVSALCYAEMAAMVEQGRIYCDYLVQLHNEGKLDSAMASAAKYNMTELQCKVADECVQLHGGYGYMWEYGVARAWADARVQRIYAGTNEIMKELIARKILK
jgi:amino acid permease